MKNILIAVLGGLFLLSCQKTNCGCGEDWTNRMDELYIHNESKINIQQGIAGTLSQIEGNCMPPVDGNNCREFPIHRTIRVYEYTTLSDVTQESATTFSAVNSTLIGTVTTDKEGYYQLELDEGTYSVFIEENDLLYANGFDGDGGIVPVQIVNDSLSLVNLKIDYAVY